MSLYDASVPQFIKQFKNLEGWLDKAEAHAKAKGFDPAVYLSSRLAPDQFAFTRQVQIATDAARLGLARITGKELPNLPDTETSLAELRTRIQKTVAYLEALKPADFEGANGRKLKTAAGKFALGKDHLFEHVIPTVYFHLVTTYSILRHNGVDVGKRDYLGPQRLTDE
jgi:uncharacterized protein